MRLAIAGVMVVFGILTVSGCGGPGPTEPGGGAQLPPDSLKAQEEANKKKPEEMMEMMKANPGKAGDPTKKK